MAKRLTEKQKELILKSFIERKTIEELSKEFNCSKLTITRNLERILGKKKYKETCILNKKDNDIRVNYSLSQQNSKKNKDINSKKSQKKNTYCENPSEADFFSDSNFLEITPLDCQIEDSPRKELSSIPITEIDFPKTVYMVVDKQIELEIKLLKDFPEWQFLPHEDLSRKTIEVFFDLNLAKRSCNKDQKVLKVPNTDVFRIASPVLIAKGISRIVCAENLIAL